MSQIPNTNGQMRAMSTEALIELLKTCIWWKRHYVTIRARRYPGVQIWWTRSDKICAELKRRDGL